MNLSSRGTMIYIGKFLNDGDDSGRPKYSGRPKWATPMLDYHRVENSLSLYHGSIGLVQVGVTGRRLG